MKWNRAEPNDSELTSIKLQVSMANNIGTLDSAINRLEKIMNGTDFDRAKMARLIHDKVLKLKACCDDHA